MRRRGEGELGLPLCPVCWCDLFIHVARGYFTIGMRGSRVCTHGQTWGRSWKGRLAGAGGGAGAGGNIPVPLSRHICMYVCMYVCIDLREFLTNEDY